MCEDQSRESVSLNTISNMHQVSARHGHPLNPVNKK